MNIDQIQQALFASYDIKNNIPKRFKTYIVNPDSDESVLDYLDQIIDLLEEMENEYEEDNPR